MKTRNVRKRQWERYITQIRKLPADPKRLTLGGGYARQACREFSRRDRKSGMRQTLKRRKRIARAFGVPLRVLTYGR